MKGRFETVNSVMGYGELFLTFLRLGLTAFGGPAAHLGYFREEFVRQKDCLSEKTYADLIALCQFLPGPASSQVCISIGMLQKGLLGGVVAWTAFVLPSTVCLMMLAVGLQKYGGVLSAEALDGFKIVALAVVAKAIVGMAGRLCPDRPRILCMLLATLLLAVLPHPAMPIALILCAGLCGALLFCEKDENRETEAPQAVRAPAWISVVLYAVGFGLFQGWVNQFYIAGGLVFGGGHVVLPLLKSELVPQMISEDHFLAGYGAAQAVPGPLFTFAAYLGVMLQEGIHGLLGGVLALLVIYLPSFFLLAGVLPYWNYLLSLRLLKGAMKAVNAAVVGLLLAAFYDPLFLSAIDSSLDFALAAFAFCSLQFFRISPVILVLLYGVGGLVISV